MKDRAVSPLIGMIFILMIVMITLSIIQAYQVPKWSEKAEMQHYNKLLSEVSELSTLLLSDKPASIKIDAGLNYPKYPFLLTPPPASTTVYSIERFVKIEYTALLPNGTKKEFRLSNKTYEIYFKPNYYYMNVYSSLGVIVFENGMVFRKGTSFVIPVTHQTLFVANKIMFPIISTDIRSLSTTSTLNLKVIPLKTGYTVATQVKISFETEFGGYWNNTLSNWSKIMKSKGYNVSYKVSPLSGVYEVNVEITGNSEKTVLLSTPTWFVGRGLPSETSTSAILVVNPKSLTIPDGSVARVSVWVFDRFGRPIPNIKVNYSINGKSVAVVSASPVTDSSGEAYFYLRAESIGSGDIKFYAGSAVAIVPYTVVSSAIQRQVVLNPVKDTYVSSALPNKNFGKETYLEVGPGEYTLVQFDLSTIPRDSTIQDAKLKLYLYSSTAKDYETITVHHILQKWQELNVTWYTLPSYSQQIIAYQIVPPIANTWISFDVTSDVQNIVNGISNNYGWLLSSPNPSGVLRFYSREWNATVCPKLVVVYTPPSQTTATTTGPAPTTTVTTTPTPAPTPTPTPPLHTSSLEVRAYKVFFFIVTPVRIEISYTGDFTGSQFTPFTLTKSVYGNSAFTVTLNAPGNYGSIYVFDHWTVDGTVYYTPTITITVPDNSKLTAEVYYRFVI